MEANTEKAKRFNTGKMDWALLDFKALEPMVEAMMHGEKDYGRHNWKNGMDMEILLGCAFRHLTAIATGETIDPDSGVLHAGHLLANIMMISHYHQKEQLEFFSEKIKQIIDASKKEESWKQTSRTNRKKKKS